MSVDETNKAVALQQTVVMSAELNAQIGQHQSALSRHLQIIRARRQANPKFHHSARRLSYV